MCTVGVDVQIDQKDRFTKVLEVATGIRGAGTCVLGWAVGAWKEGEISDSAYLLPKLHTGASTWPHYSFHPRVALALAPQHPFQGKHAI